GGPDKERQVLLRGKTPDVERDRLVATAAPGAAQPLAAAGRGEEPVVHTATHDPDPPESAGFQGGLHLGRRYQGAIGAVVEGAQVSRDDAGEYAEPVMSAVAMEVRVKVGADRYSQSPGGTYRRPAQRAFGDHLYDVGAPLRPRVVQRAR